LRRLPVIHGRGEDLTRVGDGAQELDTRQRPARRVGGKRLDPQAERDQARHERIMARQGIRVARQDIERRSHVPHDIALDEPEAVVVKAAQFHFRCGATALLRAFCEMAEHLAARGMIHSVPKHESLTHRQQSTEEIT